MRLNKQSIAIFFAALVVSFAVSARSQERGMKSMDMPMKPGDKIPPASELKPAEGASVKIIAPKKGEVFQGDQVSLQFKMVKGKAGRHVHAYVDGQLMGMFESEARALYLVAAAPLPITSRTNPVNVPYAMPPASW